MTKRRSPDAQRLLDARKAAAKELKLDPSDWRVRRYALLALSIENIEAALATGEDLDTDALSKIDAQMQQIRDTLPPEKLQVTVQYVEGCIGIYTCVHCHKRNELQPGSYTPVSGRHYEISGPNDTKDSPTRGLEAAKVSPRVDAKTNAPATPVEAVKTPPAVKSLPVPAPSPPRSHPASIHDAPGARMKPSENGSAVWFGGGASSYPLTRER